MDIKEILEEISLPARSNKHGFKVTDKLEKIEQLLKDNNSPYHIIKKTDHAWIFGQENPSMGNPAVLISSHADIVSDITKPFSEYNEETKYFKGTYDNMGTNGACTELMINRDMPKNVYFSFTAEEESGRNTGAEFSLAYMKNRTGTKPLVFVLDCTYDGYDENRLFTIEGLNAPTEELRKGLLNNILSTEGDNPAFLVIKMKKKDDNSFLPQEYQTEETTDPDESYYYASQKCLSFSFDLPTDGVMHSDSGLYVKEAVMRGYIDSLQSAIYSITNTYTDRIDDIKKIKDERVKEAKETSFYKTASYFSGYSGFSYPYGYGYYNDYYDYNSEEGIFIPDLEPLFSGKMTVDDLYYEDQTFAIWYDDFVQMAMESAEYYGENDIDTFIEDMAGYCNLPELPDELAHIVVAIWKDMRGYYEDEDYEEDEEDIIDNKNRQLTIEDLESTWDNDDAVWLNDENDEDKDL